MRIPFRRTTLYTTSKVSATRVQPLDEAKAMRRAKITERRYLPERRDIQSHFSFEDRRKSRDRRTTAQRTSTHIGENDSEQFRGQLIDTTI